MKPNYEKIFKSGNFGKVDFGNGDEDFFVVVNNILVYKNHGYDFITSYKNEYLTTCTGSKIIIVVENQINSYENLEKFLNGTLAIYGNPVVWKRNEEITKEKKSTRATLTLTEIKEKLGVDELTIICE